VCCSDVINGTLRWWGEIPAPVTVTLTGWCDKTRKWHDRRSPFVITSSFLLKLKPSAVRKTASAFQHLRNIDAFRTDRFPCWLCNVRNLNVCFSCPLTPKHVSEAHVETMESREIKDGWILMQRSQIYLEDVHYIWDVSNHMSFFTWLSELFRYKKLVSVAKKRGTRCSLIWGQNICKMFHRNIHISYALIYCTYSHKDENAAYFYHGSVISFGPCTPSAEQKFRHTHMILESSVEIFMFCAPCILIHLYNINQRNAHFLN
jgi:hypothetical protein